MVNISNIKQKGYAHNFVESSIILNVPIPNRHIYFVGIKLYPNMIVFVNQKGRIMKLDYKKILK